MAEKAEDLLQQLMQQIAVVNDVEGFKKTHGFYLKDYLDYRKQFAGICRKHADHIEEVVHDTGIARTTGGAVGIVAGGASIAGLFLAPFTAGASLLLTAGGIAGGVVSAGTAITAELVKNGHIKNDREKIEAALQTFDSQEKVIGKVFSEIDENMKKLRELMEKPDVLKMICDVASGVKQVGWNIAYQGVNLVKTVNAIRFARSVADFIQADFYAMTAIAKGMSTPGLTIPIWGRTVVAAGTTTAKVLSGAMGAIGIGAGIWDVVKGAEDINGSEVAKEYRKFAGNYEKETKNLSDGIDVLEKLDA